jgi:hypothetical protein
MVMKSFALDIIGGNMFKRGDRVIRIRGMNAGMVSRDKGTVIEVSDCLHGTYLCIAEYRGLHLHEAECFKLLLAGGDTTII